MNRRSRWIPCATSALVLFAVGAAQAQEGGPPPSDPAAPPADAPPPGPLKVKATSIALPHKDVPDDVMASIVRALDTALKQNDRLEVKDLDTRLADFAQEVPQDQVDAARQALKDGQQMLLEMSFAEAQKKLQEAVTGLAGVLPYIKKQELADAMASLAVAHLESGDKVAGRMDFVRLLIWRSDYAYDVSKLPPKYLGAFEEAQRVVDKLKKGSLRIVSNPEGAQAYVDGKYIGLTPCGVTDLVAGEHYVTLKKEGYRKAVAPAQVPAKKEQKIEIELSRNEKYLLVEQAVAGLDATIGSDLAPPEMENFKQVLFLDQAVFVRARPRDVDSLDVTVWMYDLRNKHKISQIEKTVPKNAIEANMATVAQQLYLNVNYEGELVAPPEKEPPKPVVRPPLWKQWWLWTAIGAVVVGVAVTTTTVIALTPPSCPEGALCPTVRF